MSKIEENAPIVEDAVVVEQETEVTTPETEEEQEHKEVDLETMSDEERLALINQFNKERKGQMHIIERRATQEDIDEAKKEYEALIEENRTHSYVLADKDNALRVAKLLKELNTDYVEWKERLWMGVITFDEFITKFIDKFDETAPVELNVDWGNLTYLFCSLPTITGHGLSTAKRFSEIYDEYVKVLEVVQMHSDNVMAFNERVRKAQERWSMASVGFILVYDDEEDGEEGDAQTEE